MLNLKLLIPGSSAPQPQAALSPAVFVGTALQAQPATADTFAPNPPDQTVFPGVTRPSVDISAVRSGQRSPIQTIVIDLTAARTIAAGTALILTAPGTSLYVDKSNDVGYATAHIQDQSATPVNSVLLFPGEVIPVPFTFLVIENTPQNNKKLRIHITTDGVFTPGIAADQGVMPAVLDKLVFQSFVAGLVQGAVAAQKGYVQLFNPAVGGAGTVLIDAFWAQEFGAAMEVVQLYDTGQFGGGISLQSKRLGGVSLAKLASTTLAADPGTASGSMIVGFEPATSYRRYPVSPPIGLAPGTGYELHGSVVNTALFFGFEWREYP